MGDPGEYFWCSMGRGSLGGLSHRCASKVSCRSLPGRLDGSKLSFSSGPSLCWGTSTGREEGDSAFLPMSAEGGGGKVWDRDGGLCRDSELPIDAVSDFWLDSLSCVCSPGGFDVTDLALLCDDVGLCETVACACVFDVEVEAEDKEGTRFVVGGAGAVVACDCGLRETFLVDRLCLSD